MLTSNQIKVQLRHSLPIGMIVVLSLSNTLPVFSAIDNNGDNSAYTPSGTLLLPLSPKLDAPTSKSSTQSNSTNKEEVLTGELETVAAEKGAPTSPVGDDIEEIDDSKTLKGTIQIVADDTEFDQQNNTFLGTGNAVAIIGGQDSKLQADSILYDQNKQLIDARGNVSILRQGQLTTGSSFKFNVTSDEYLITKPSTSINNTQVVARKSLGTKTGIAYKDGTMQMPMPFFFGKNAQYGPLSYREDYMNQRAHPEAYLPEHGSYKFRAQKMVYERYKDKDNLTIFGGRVEIGDFSVPVGKITMTVGQTDTKVVMPVTPYIGNNLWTGGMNIGPQFNTGITKNSVVSWCPMVQLGGRNLSTNSSSSGLGISGRAAFFNPNFQSHLAYASNGNLLVGDIKARIWRTTKLQAGINRFMNDGMFGMVRPRLIAEVVDQKTITKVPYLAYLTFRTSGGWAQDDPTLVNVSSLYAQLHGSPTQTVMTSAYKVQEQIMFTTHPLFNVGDDRYGVKAFIYGGAAARGYSTGDSNLVTQLGPVVNFRLNKVFLQTGYTSSSVNGNSPFVFDQYIQGQNSVYLQGDVKISKYLTVGGMTGYNMTQKLSYARQLIAAVGPPDFKLIVGKDFVLNNYRVGFNLLYGQPVQFNKLVFKGSADQGQLSGAGGI